MYIRNLTAGAAILALSLTGSSIAISQEAQTFRVVGTLEQHLGLAEL